MSKKEKGSVSTQSLMNIEKITNNSHDQRDAGPNSHTEINEKGKSNACVDTDYEPMAFREHSKLSQHISFLKDFFRCYKEFDDKHIDVIEIMLSRLYTKWNISDSTDFTSLQAEQYPILSDLYALIEEEYKGYDKEKYQLYTADLLQEILLGLHSICMGAESKFFNGYTNITSNLLHCLWCERIITGEQECKKGSAFQCTVLYAFKNISFIRANTEPDDIFAILLLEI